MKKFKTLAIGLLISAGVAHGMQLLHKKTNEGIQTNNEIQIVSSCKNSENTTNNPNDNVKNETWDYFESIKDLKKKKQTKHKRTITPYEKYLKAYNEKPENNDESRSCIIL